MMPIALLLAAILGGDSPAAPTEGRAHVVRVEVAADHVDAPYSPMSIEIEGAALLRTAGSNGRFAADSLQLCRVHKDGSKEPILFNASESFLHSDKAELRWVIERPDECVYLSLRGIATASN